MNDFQSIVSEIAGIFERMTKTHRLLFTCLMGMALLLMAIAAGEKVGRAAFYLFG
jgi:hypothetical protein